MMDLTMSSSGSLKSTQGLYTRRGRRSNAKNEGVTDSMQIGASNAFRGPAALCYDEADAIGSWYENASTGTTTCRAGRSNSNYVYFFVSNSIRSGITLLRNLMVANDESEEASTWLLGAPQGL